MEQRAVSSAANGQLTRDYVATVRVAMEMAATRWLTLVALVGAVAMFGFATYAPERERTIVATLYTVTVLVPLVWAVARKG